MRLFWISSNFVLNNPNIKCHHAHQKISEGLIEFLAQLSITIVTLFNYVGSMLDSISNCVVMSPEDTFEIISFFQLILQCFCAGIMAQESMTVWETAEAKQQRRWWLEEDTQSIPYTDTSHSYLISKRARSRQESSSYSIRRGLYDKLFWCTMEKRIVEELMTSQKDSQSSSSDRIKKKSQSWRVELGKTFQT